MTLEEFVSLYGNQKAFDYTITSAELIITLKEGVKPGAYIGLDLPDYMTKKTLDFILAGRPVVNQIKGSVSGVSVVAIRVRSL